jgi:hypothetical protein
VESRQATVQGCDNLASCKEMIDMDKWREIVWDLLIGVLVIFFGGWVLGSIVNQAAMVSPHMVSLVYCREGSTATTFQPLTCRDENGVVQPPLADEDSIVLQRKYFYRPSTYALIILVIGWVIWRRIKQKGPSAITNSKT